jgi:four helix bundle protein
MMLAQRAFPQGRGAQRLNIAEGAGEYSRADKARFYRMAKRSATEAAAILDLARKLEIISRERFDAGRALLLRIVSMLIKMVRGLDS